MTTFPIMMTGRHVEEAVIETCVKWGAEFISEGERQFGIEPHSVPVPALGQYTTTSTAFEKWPEDQTPAVLVIAPGLTGPPRIEADRSLTAPLGLGLGFLVSTSHGPTANRELAAFYAAVFSELILRMPLQLQNVPVGVDEITYLDERYGDIPRERDRILGGSRLVFELWIKHWRSLKGRPPLADPRPDPYGDPGDWPRVESVFNTLNVVRRIEDG